MNRRLFPGDPIHMKRLLMSLGSEVRAVTKNVSVFGLLIDTSVAIPQDFPVEFTVVVHGGHVTRPIPVSGV